MFLWGQITSIIAMVAVILSFQCKIRNMRFFFVSPVWIINNTLVCFTVGGIACEIITMVSIIVSFIRYRKIGFEA